MSAAPPVELDAEGFLQRLLHEQSDLSAVERFIEAKQNSDAAEAQEPAQAKYYRSLIPTTQPEGAEQYAFEVDMDACSGCKSCVVACHTMNGLEEDESWRRVGALTSTEDVSVSQYVTTACHHCADPGCLNGCPVMAYDKDPVTGIVRHLDDQCIGCKYCTMMCPYEVPQYSHRLGIVRKCDMCHQRLSNGEAPACVQSCPNEAISIRIVPSEPSPERESRLVASAPLSSITKPTTVFRSSKPTTQTALRPLDAEVDRPEEAHWPLVMMLVLTQLSVGAAVCGLLVACVSSISNDNNAANGLLYSFIAALVFCAIGLAAASLHLGQPLRAWRVFLGIGRSWLSREAICFGKYFGALLAAVAFLSFERLEILPWMPAWASTSACAAAVVLGVAGLVCSAMIYIATRREVWNMQRTMASFVGTALVLGSGIVAIAFASWQLGIGALAIFLMKSALEHQSRKPQVETKKAASKSLWARSERLRTESFGKWDQCRRVAAAAGCLLLGLGISLLALGPTTPGLVCSSAALAAWLVSEILERAMYFSTVVFDRMPGSPA